MGGITETVFDYQGLRRNMDAEFTDYLNALALMSPLSDFPEDEQWAILINAYNAFTVNMVVQNPTKLRLGKLAWPIRSIRDISVFFKSVWDLPTSKFGGTMQSLNQIEATLRNMQDPRIHACIVCASVSCPNLQPIAYTGKDIDAQKNHSMTEFLSNTGKGLSIDETTNTMYVSSIFNWFASDFEDDACPCLNRGAPFGSVQNFIMTFAPSSVQDYYNANSPTLDYLSYDWFLNSLSSAHPPPSFW